MSFIDEYNQKLDKAMKESDELGEGVKVGKIFSLPVADGFAYYKVVKVNKRTAKVEWVEELSLDDYQDMMLGDGGTVQIDRIEHLINYQMKLRQLMEK